MNHFKHIYKKYQEGRLFVGVSWGFHIFHCDNCTPKSYTTVVDLQLPHNPPPQSTLISQQSTLISTTVHPNLTIIHRNLAIIHDSDRPTGRLTSGETETRQHAHVLEYLPLLPAWTRCFSGPENVKQDPRKAKVKTTMPQFEDTTQWPAVSWSYWDRNSDDQPVKWQIICQNCFIIRSYQRLGERSTSHKSAGSTHIWKLSQHGKITIWQIRDILQNLWKFANDNCNSHSQLLQGVHD